MKTSAFGFMLIAALLSAQQVVAAEPNIIRIPAPIRQGVDTSIPPAAEDPVQAYNVTVGYHPNPNCAYKMRGYGVSSVCTSKSGSFGSISSNEATIAGVKYTVPQIIGWKNGAACMYSFMVSNAAFDSVPTTIQTTWNGVEFTQTKSTRGLPGVLTWDTTASCDLYDSLAAGSTLNVVLKEK